jgi:DNA-binding transcriptional MocR family regulator
VAVQYRLSGDTATTIAASVEQGVREQALLPGSALPAVRTLAADLGVSPATVAAAYQRLRQRGIVSTAGRNGTRIRSATPISALRSARQIIAPEGLRDLASGAPDPAELPLPGNYRDGGVLPGVLAAARKRLPLKGSFTLVSGALDGMDRVLLAHLRPGDRVGVEDPGWAACLDLLAMQGLVPVPVPVDDDGPTVAGLKSALDSGISALIVTARAQNPTGGSISAARAKALRPLLTGLLVIEDDHAAELAGVPLHPVADAGAHWAFIRSASKPFGPDLRCAVLAGDAETVSRVEGRMRLGAGWVSTVLQRELLRLWSTFDPAPAGRRYDSRRAAVLTALARRGITALGKTGINIWVPVPDETKAVSVLRDAGFAVAPGHLFRLTSPPGIRVTIATVTETDVEPLAEAIAAATETGLRGMLGR